jgi:hypothetical protein
LSWREKQSSGGASSSCVLDPLLRSCRGAAIRALLRKHDNPMCNIDASRRRDDDRCAFRRSPSSTEEIRVVHEKLRA